MNNECSEVKELIPLYQVGELSDEKKDDLKKHLLFCSECVYRLVLSAG